VNGRRLGHVPIGRGVADVVGGFDPEGVSGVQGADKGGIGIIHRGQPVGPGAAVFADLDVVVDADVDIHTYLATGNGEVVDITAKK